VTNALISSREVTLAALGRIMARSMGLADKESRLPEVFSNAREN